MKCINCRLKSCHDGVIMHGVHNTYGLCRECFMLATKEYKNRKHYKDEKQNTKFNTIQKKRFLQEKIDNKLNQYLLEV